MHDHSPHPVPSTSAQLARIISSPPSDGHGTARAGRDRTTSSSGSSPLGGTLTLSDIRRLRTAMRTSTREVSAVLSEIEQRIGREVELSDIEEVACGQHGRLPTVQRKTATYVRQLLGWGGAGALYALSPGLETTTGEVARFALAIVHAPEPHVSRYGRPGEVTVSLHPATECGATWGEARFVGHERYWHAEDVQVAFSCLDYDLVRPAPETPKARDLDTITPVQGGPSVLSWLRGASTPDKVVA